MINHIYIQVIYVLVSSVILFTIYQLLTYKKPNTEDNSNKSQQQQSLVDKLKVFAGALIICTGIVFYFKIGVDEIKYGGEVKLNDLVQFEKTMISNIRQDVDVSNKAPF
jgi:hypothetical protein